MTTADRYGIRGGRPAWAYQTMQGPASVRSSFKAGVQVLGYSGQLLGALHPGLHWSCMICTRLPGWPNRQLFSVMLGCYNLRGLDGPAPMTLRFGEPALVCLSTASKQCQDCALVYTCAGWC